MTPALPADVLPTLDYMPSEEVVRRMSVALPSMFSNAVSGLGAIEAQELFGSTLSVVVYTVLGQIASNHSVEGDAVDPVISDGSCFTSGFSMALVRSFEIREADAAPMLECLHADLMRFVRDGGVLSGPWGHVAGAADTPLMIVPSSEVNAYFADLKAG